MQGIGFAIMGVVARLLGRVKPERDDMATAYRDLRPDALLGGMDPLSVIGLGPHEFSDPYEAFEDDEVIECCGVPTKWGSPCGYPRELHRLTA